VSLNLLWDRKELQAFMSIMAPAEVPLWKRLGGKSRWSWFERLFCKSMISRVEELERKFEEEFSKTVEWRRLVTDGHKKPKRKRRRKKSS